MIRFQATFNMRWLFAACLLWGLSIETLRAQSVCLPLPRLLTTMPMGGKVGAEVEVVVSGEHIEECRSLLFDHPGIQATSKLDGNGQPVPNTFTVRIAHDCPPGLYEARVMTRLGVSSSRIFCVDTLDEFQPKSPNLTMESAMEMAVNSVVNGVASAKAVDHYFFQAKKGSRYFVYCASRGIDSKLDPVLILADGQGRDLKVERRGDVLDFVAEQDGKYVIKVHELTFRGGPAFYYRLFLKESNVDEGLPKFASTHSVNSFSWPPMGLPEEAAIQELEPKEGEEVVQRVVLPLDVMGSFFPAADNDLFEFDAKKGEEWWIEVGSERLGRPTDPAVLIQKVVEVGGVKKFEDLLELNDIASPMKPSSNGYAYDGPPYDGGSSDVLGKLVVPEDGTYRLQLSDLFGGTRKDPRNVYRLVIRKAAPDFAIAAWGMHMELRNGDRNALSKPLALRCGATVAIEVVVLRRDGFQGEIRLTTEGLPDGVTAHAMPIPSGKSRGILLLTAHQDAPPALAELQIYGESLGSDGPIKRKVQMAQMAWPVPDAWSEIPSPRLVNGVFMSVSSAEYAPLTIAGAVKSIEAKVGEKVALKYDVTRRSEFSGGSVQMRAFGEGFESSPRWDLSLSASSAEVTLDLAALKTPPGVYTIAFYGAAVAKYVPLGQTAPQDTVDIVITDPVTLHVKSMESP